MTDRDNLPHGTILCPTCGCSHSGCIDSPICDECNNPFWPIDIIEKSLDRIKNKLEPLQLDESEHSFLRKIRFKCTCLHEFRNIGDEDICS